jgi:hypothetical protein
LAFAAVSLAFLAWRWSVVGDYGWTHDEGAYVSAAWMVHKGAALYRETMTSSPPLFIHLLSLGMSLWGPSVAAARWVVVIYLWIGFVAIGLAARELDGWPAAILAPLGLMVIPEVRAPIRARVAGGEPAPGRCGSAGPAHADRTGGLRREPVVSGSPVARVAHRRGLRWEC